RRLRDAEVMDRAPETSEERAIFRTAQAMLCLLVERHHELARALLASIRRHHADSGRPVFAAFRLARRVVVARKGEGRAARRSLKRKRLRACEPARLRTRYRTDA